MYRRKRTAILAIILIGLVSLMFSSRALAKLTTLYPAAGETPGIELVLSPEVTTSDLSLELTLAAAEKVVAHRLAQLEIPAAYQIHQSDGQLVVTLPGGVNTPYINNVIAHVGEIQFIDGGVDAPPIGEQIQTGPVTDPAENMYELLFTGENVSEVVLPDVGTGQIFYEMSLDDSASENFEDFFATQPENYVCIVMDQEVISCSEMYYWADGVLEIIPSLSSGSVTNLAELAIFLNSGPLPYSFDVQ
ncbi:MAG: hypothetical protein R3264_15855 [Anaerolineae bacterium]|nr:hypothetical protein [Anaerolineae bacterium]